MAQRPLTCTYLVALDDTARVSSHHFFKLFAFVGHWCAVMGMPMTRAMHPAPSSILQSDGPLLADDRAALGRVHTAIDSKRALEAAVADLTAQITLHIDAGEHGKAVQLCRSVSCFLSMHSGGAASHLNALMDTVNGGFRPSCQGPWRRA